MIITALIINWWVNSLTVERKALVRCDLGGGAVGPCLEPVRLFWQAGRLSTWCAGCCYRGATPRRDYQDAKHQTSPSKWNLAGWTWDPLNGPRHPNWAGGKACVWDRSTSSRRPGQRFGVKSIGDGDKKVGHVPRRVAAFLRFLVREGGAW